MTEEVRAEVRAELVEIFTGAALIGAPILTLAANPVAGLCVAVLELAVSVVLLWVME
jgi:hypothetical protein